jgi:hypothetical protein
MKISRTFLLIAALAILLLGASGCRLGSRLQNGGAAAPTQASQPAQVQATPQTQPTQAGAAASDDDLQDLINTLDQLDRENGSADALNDLP